MKPVRELDAGDPHVQFDEGMEETTVGATRREGGRKRTLAAGADKPERHRASMPPLPGTSRLLTVREVAGRLAVSTATIYALCERGQIRHVRISNAIRVELAEVEAFVARQRRR